jgi:NAD(P)H-hydrate epimerase
MKLPTGKKMSEIDRITSSEYFISSAVLMENAGINVCDKIVSDFSDITCLVPFILSGPGNNGGDGFVIARRLLTRGIGSFCIFIGDYKKLKGDAKTNFDIITRLSANYTNLCIVTIETLEKWNEYKGVVFCCEYLIDCLFGTGLSSPVSGIYKNIIDDINTSFSGKVLSVDVPSGLICDSSSYQGGSVINASKTYAIGCPKLATADYPGKGLCGELDVVDIGFPETLTQNKSINTNLFTLEDAKKIKPVRAAYSNKGDYGHLLAIAGSSAYKGAADLSTRAAFSSGAGLVTLFSVKDVCKSVSIKNSHIITRDTGGDDTISKEDLKVIKDTIQKYNACLIGPGLSLNDETSGFVEEFLTSYKGVCVVDADALNIISNDISLLKKTSCKKLILTPHMGEFSRLTKLSIDSLRKDKLGYALDFSTAHNVILVIKDAVTLTVSKEEAYYNSSGNAGLSRGGSGDVLAGAISAFAARGMTPLNASLFGVFLCGLTADILFEERGVEGVYPLLVAENIYRGLKKIG